jgi:ubiquinone/menaquinone biosynthesis C-methylase UbiE
MIFNLKQLELMTGWKGAVYRKLTRNIRQNTGTEQELDLYFDENFAKALENWADDTCWPEIEMLLRNRSGKVLDLACGTGRANDFLRTSMSLEYYGCDISEPLIKKAMERGIPQSRLCVGNAAKLEYKNAEFEYLFSIGSLEHFSIDILDDTLKECRRVCTGINFHLLPVSGSNMDEGWFASYQAYWNNSERWWVERFVKHFGKGNVWTMTSRWSDKWSRGVWFICLSK